jgi:anti-anti-sigma factor
LPSFEFIKQRRRNAALEDVTGGPIGIDHEPLGETRWLFVLEGELDLASADRVRDALAGPIRDGAEGIVVDLARCTFVDSSGLGVLIEAQKTLNGSSPHHGLALVAPAQQPRRLLKLTSVERFLPIYESRVEAEAALTGSDGASST